MSRANELWGAKSLDHLFPGGATTAPTPWPTARKTPILRSHNLPMVHDAMRNPDAHFRDMDPRELHGTQDMLTRVGVSHYLQGSSGTFADQGNAGNEHPVVFHNEKYDQNVLLTGHHRAASALLQGQNFRPIYVSGPPLSHRETSAYQNELIQAQRRLRGN